MSLQLHKRSILRKSFQYSFFTFISRILGLVREYYQVRYLGISPLSDAFIIAFRLPNSLRKVFAEGALSAAFVPTFIKIYKEKNTSSANRLMSLAFVFFEGIILLLTILVWIFPGAVIRMVSPGFSEAQFIPAIVSLRILFPFILFISSGALLAGALQSVNHFFMPAFSQVLLNIVFIASFVLCLKYNLSIEYLCCGILLGGIIQFIFYLLFYFKYGFKFQLPNVETKKRFKSVLKKFANCILGVGVMELNLIVDGIIGSYLADGSISLLYYGTRFMQIPLAVIAISFSTVLLSHFSRVALYAPKRLSVYLLEASKFVAWATIPATLFLMFVSEKIFSTSIMAKNVKAEKVGIAGTLLFIMACGLLFFAINKILTNVFYSLGDTKTPAIASAIATVINLVGNVLSFWYLGDNAIYGIATSTVIFGIFHAFLSFYLLRRKYNYRFYIINFLKFLFSYILQLLAGAVIFWFLYTAVFGYLAITSYYYFFFMRWGYWIIMFPLTGFIAAFLYFTRRLFGINLYFLRK
ncbi:murein biosynthesis integral membrane protein MurJ [Candidatus Babeliales bacterium]|nr:murein biosynthesis integral membrane protein MurJ [Candidatus Babeliales bacterium]